MKILSRYVLKEFVVNLALALCVSLFVLLAGKVFKELLTVMIARHLGWEVLAGFVACAAPFMLMYCLPLAVMTASVMTFSKMSAENEVLAAQASGISVWRFATPVVLLGCLAGCVALYSNSELSPRGLATAQRLVRDALLDKLENDPTVLFETDRDIKDIPDIILRVGDKDRATGTLKDIRLLVMEGGNIRYRYSVESASVQVVRDKMKIVVTLRNLSGDEIAPRLRPGIRAEEVELDFELERYLGRSGRSAKWTDKTLWELAALRDGQESARARSEISMEMHMRVTLAFACIVFVMVGVPLGIKTHRRETSVGVLVGLVVTMVYFALIIAAQSLKSRPEYHPVWILWTPSVLGEAFGIWLFVRLARRP
jgi:lipopolysaccharide export system permease protein